MKKLNRNNFLLQILVFYAAICIVSCNQVPIPGSDSYKFPKPNPASIPASLSMKIFDCGAVLGPVDIIYEWYKSNTYDVMLVPSTIAAVTHPAKNGKGTDLILFDTGYHTDQDTNLKESPWYLFYITTTPTRIRPWDNALCQLNKNGYLNVNTYFENGLPGMDPQWPLCSQSGDKCLNKKGKNPVYNSITILLSHGHVDHVGGLDELMFVLKTMYPNTPITAKVTPMEWFDMHYFIGYTPVLYESLKEGETLELISFKETGKPWGPFDKAIDLYGDQTMVLVPLYGHSSGQFGMVVNLPDSRTIFLNADAAHINDWFLNDPICNSVMCGAFMAKDFTGGQYLSNLYLLRHIYHSNVDPDPDKFLIVSSHDARTWRKLLYDEHYNDLGIPAFNKETDDLNKNGFDDAIDYGTVTVP